MNKILSISIVFLITGCSKISTFKEFGTDLEAYYSDKTQVVCFTTSPGNRDNVYCLPAASVDISRLEPNKWGVV